MHLNMPYDKISILLIYTSYRPVHSITIWTHMEKTNHLNMIYMYYTARW